MSSDLDTLWAQALEAIQTEDENEFNKMWMYSTQPLSLEQDTLVVAVPNKFMVDWMRGKHMSLLKNRLADVADRPLDVRFIISDESMHSSAQDETAAAAPAGGTSPPSPAAAQSAPQKGVTRVEIHDDEQRAAKQPLNPRYTFNNFVIGASNRLAHAASLAVSQSPGQAYNPLFLYGGVGLGKTHLMQAIAHAVITDDRDLRVVYISSETFANELITAIRDNTTAQFRKRYRNVDVLLVDDVQFIAGKETTQVEFFHTFNTLHEANKQIVMSSDRPPKEIPTLEERLRSRFEWGLTSDIQAPELETRIAILQKKGQLEGINVPDEVINYIAQRVDTNIRELEGALIRLIASASMDNSQDEGQPVITLDYAREALADIIPDRESTVITVDQIMEQVAGRYDLAVEDLLKRKRTRAIAYPRQIAMYLARDLTEHSLPQIGEEFGGRDHTTVMHACDKIKNELENDEKLQRTIEKLRRDLAAG